MKITRLIAAIITAAFALSLSACSQQGGSGNENTDEFVLKLEKRRARSAMPRCR